MAVPKKKRSKSRTRTNHAINTRLEKKNTGICKNCGAPVLPHLVCDNCGFYKGRKVMVTKREKAELKKARREASQK